MKFIKFSQIILCILVLSSCGSKKQKENIESNDNISAEERQGEIPLAKDTTVFFSFAEENDISCTILYPEKKAEASVLVLHGCNLPADEICEKTSFIPDFGKTNYSLDIYPQTIDAYTKYPTLQWMINTFIPTLQKEFHVLKEEQISFVYGISTGGRGASLFAYHLPEVFDAAATLSGDFDIYDFTNAYIYYSFFGKQEDFPARWDKQAFVNDCQHYTVPTYIGHGKLDMTVDVIQSQKMFDSIKKHQKNLQIRCSFTEDGKHDYTYWESETDNVLEFFGTIKQELTSSN
jgi:esterase/lipase superfamily enzyme